MTTPSSRSSTPPAAPAVLDLDRRRAHEMVQAYSTSAAWPSTAQATSTSPAPRARPISRPRQGRSTPTTTTTTRGQRRRRRVLHAAVLDGRSARLHLLRRPSPRGGVRHRCRRSRQRLRGRDHEFIDQHHEPGTGFFPIIGNAYDTAIGGLPTSSWCASQPTGRPTTRPTSAGAAWTGSSDQRRRVAHDGRRCVHRRRRRRRLVPDHAGDAPPGLSGRWPGRLRAPHGPGPGACQPADLRHVPRRHRRRLRRHAGARCERPRLRRRPDELQRGELPNGADVERFLAPRAPTSSSSSWTWGPAAPPAGSTPCASTASTDYRATSRSTPTGRRGWP